MNRQSDPKGVTSIPFLLCADNEIVPVEALGRYLDRMALDAQKIEAKILNGVCEEHIIAVVAVIVVLEVINRLHKGLLIDQVVDNIITQLDEKEVILCSLSKEFKSIPRGR
jgi:hypothetical protein